MNPCIKLLLSFLIFINVCIQAETISELEQASKDVSTLCDPLLVVVIMVKNEENVINATLEPYIEAGINSFFVLDTGSSDKTVKTVKNYLEEQDVKNAYLIEEPFVDFATSRNRALELAEEKFPNAAFFLMIDAEWYMTNVEGLIDFCKQHLFETLPSYSVRITWPGHDSRWYRLIRAHSGARFVGKVHEVLLPQSGVKVPGEIYFEFRPTEDGRKTSQLRWLRDRDLLANAI